MDSSTDANTDANTATLDAAADTGAATPDSSHAGDAQQTAGADAANTATPTTQPDGASSLATDTRNANSQPPALAAAGAKPGTPPNSPPSPAAPVVDYQKRFEDARTYMDKLARENADHRKYREQWGDLDPVQVRQQQETASRQAEALKLKPWHPGHPDAHRTDGRLARVESYKNARDAIAGDQGLDAETKTRLINSLSNASGVTQEDVALYREHQQTVQDAQVRMARDPEGFIRSIAQPMAEQIARQMVGQYDQERIRTQQTDQWMSDPKRAPLLDKYGQDVLWAMDPNTPRRDVGNTLAVLKAENEALKLKLGAERETVETANAQHIALNKRSVVKRDPNTAKAALDPVEEGLKQDLSGVDLIKHLQKRRAESVNS